MVRGIQGKWIIIFLCLIISVLIVSKPNSIKNGIQNGLNHIIQPHPFSQPAELTPKAAKHAKGINLLLRAELAQKKGANKLSLEIYQKLLAQFPQANLAKRTFEIALKQNNLKAAIDSGEIWITKAPNNIQAKRFVIQLLLQNENYTKAKSVLLGMVKNKPEKNALGIFKLSQQLRHQVYRKSLLVMLSELSQQHQNQSTLLLSTALVANSYQDNLLASKTIDQFLALKPSSQYGLILKGQIMEKSSPIKAREYYKNLLSQYPHYNKIRYVYGELLFQDKNYDQALAQLQPFMTKKPVHQSAVFLISRIYIEQKKWGEAKQSLEILSKNQTSQYLLALINEKLQNKQKAVYQFLQIPPGKYYMKSRLSAANLLVSLGKINQARNVLQTTIVYSKRQKRDLLLSESKLLENAGQLKNALHVLDIAKNKFPKNSTVLYKHSRLAQKLGQYNVAEQDLRQIIHLNPYDATALNNLGLLVAQHKKQYNQAILLLEKALKLEPQNAAIIDSLGWVYLQMGRVNSAVELFEKAYALDNTDTEIAAHLQQARKAQQALKNPL